MSLDAVIHYAHKAMSRSRIAVFAALKIRNQAEMVLECYLGENNRQERNGERELIEQVGASLFSFIDVGANVGDWSDLVLRSSQSEKRGILIEPSSSAFPRLEDRFGENERVKLVRAAVSDKAREGIFYEEAGAGETSSLLDFGHPRGPGTRTVRIPVTTVDREVSAAGWDTVDMLKIDTEGYDLHVIRGAGELLEKMAIGLLQFEYNSAWAYAGSTLASALSFLQDRNYKVFLIRTTGLHPLNYARWGEYYRMSNYLAVSPGYMPIVEKLIRREV